MIPRQYNPVLNLVFAIVGGVLLFWVLAFVFQIKSLVEASHQSRQDECARLFLAAGEGNSAPVGFTESSGRYYACN